MMPTLTCDTTTTDEAHTAAARIQALQNLSQSAYDALYLKVMRNLPKSVAEDAFSHAMEVACRDYDGRAPLDHFVLVVARNYAIGRHRRSKKLIQFADLDRNCGGSEAKPQRNQIETLRATEDKVEDPFRLIFAKHVATILQGEKMVAASEYDSLTLERAAIALQELVQSIEDDAGMGVDEYDEPIKREGPQHREQVSPRLQIEERLAEILAQRTGRSCSRATARAALAKLRLVVRRFIEVNEECTA